MKLHELSNPTERKDRKRVGRGEGGGRGKTCGRGNKGDGSRSGHHSRPHFEGGQIPLLRRLPKRGFNSPDHKEYALVNVSLLEEIFQDGDSIALETLQEHGLAKRTGAGLKVLGDGNLTKKLTVKATAFSASAKAKIEAAGGTCEIV